MSALASHSAVSRDETETAPEARPSGLYLYGIAQAGHVPETIGAEAVPGAGPVEIIPAGDLVVLASAMPVQTVPPKRRSLLAHTQVLEHAMGWGTVLPVRFGTIADTPEIVRHLIDQHRAEIDPLLALVSGRVEMGIKAFWQREVVFEEVLAENKRIQDLRDSLRGSDEARTYYQRIDLGRLIEDAMDLKRERDAAWLDETLAPLAIERTQEKVTEDRMVLNAAYLINRADEVAFDEALQCLEAEQQGRMTIRYIGPSPAYSFVRLSINWSASS